MVLAASLALLWQAGFVSGKVAASQSVPIPSGANNTSDQKTKTPDIEGEAALVSANAATWQTVINAFGLVGLAFTVLYARRAWLAARASAEADNANLELTKEALKEQREGAAEQAAMSLRQIAASEQLATAAQRQAEVARKAYVAADRPWIGIKVLGGSVDIQPDLVVVTLTTRYTNIGKGPALQVQPEVISLREGYNIGTDGFSKAVEAAFFFPLGESVLPGEFITVPQQFMVAHGPGAADRIAQAADGMFHFHGCVATKYFPTSSSDRLISARLYGVVIKRTSIGKHGGDAVEFREHQGYFT